MATTYLKEGDIVQLNKELPNRPLMMVYEIVREDPKDEAGKSPFSKLLIGIDCIWFTPTEAIQKMRFNFKDLDLVEQEDLSENNYEYTRLKNEITKTRASKSDSNN